MTILRQMWSLITFVALIGATATTQTGANSSLQCSTSRFDGSPSNPAGPLNRPDCRQQWLPGFDITQDTDTHWPVTGKIREFWLTLTNTTCNPDGSGKVECLLVNNQLPGPPITVDWGDTVRVHVLNKLSDNGTSIHFHGVRQYKTNLQDGVNGLTECPIAPGTQRTYEWVATQHGTSWYHSHYSSQYGAGVTGPIVINGPAVANYDVDLGPLAIDHWYNQPFFTAATIEENLARTGSPPPPTDNILLNGEAKSSAGQGKYHTVTVQPGKVHRLRLVNTAAEAIVRFSIDNHTMTVIAADFVPVKPYTTNSLLLGIAQRYDVLITANQSASSYWIRAFPEDPCSTDSKHPGLGVLSYTGAKTAAPPGHEPTTTPYATFGCEALTAIEPLWKAMIPQDQFLPKYKLISLNFDLSEPSTLNNDFIIWKFNSTGIDIFWDKPTVQYVAEKNTSYPNRLNVYDLENKPGDWAFFIIQSVGSLASIFSHPIHLHGHDYYTLGQDIGTFNPETDTSKLNFATPIRRDTNFLNGDFGSQQGNWMAIAFKTGNPGAWLLHCHIASHVAGGFGLQFLDTKEEMASPPAEFYQQCQSWKGYEKGAYWRKTDSGL